MEDPEFEDSIRALLDKACRASYSSCTCQAHVPVYLRPGNKVAP